MDEVINGTSGNDRLEAISDKSVKAGAGNDTITVAGAQNVTIESGQGKDVIYFESYHPSSVLFTDFDPQNDILNFPDWAFFYSTYYFRASIKDGNLILKDGLGQHTLTFKGVTSTDKIKDTIVLKWDGYAGKLGGILYNTVSGSSVNDTSTSGNVINLTNEDDNFNNSRSNVRINALSGKDTVYNLASEVTISGGAGNDSIWSHEGNKTSISGGVGDDYIANEGNNVTISGDDGNERIWNHDNDKTSINGGAGDDSIENYSYDTTISGGKGSDVIFNDCILNLYDGTIRYYNAYGSNVLFEYNAGDGNDTIYGFKSNSTLNISGESHSTIKSGDDLIIKVDNGSITLKNIADISPNIEFNNKKDNSDNPSDNDSTTSTYNDNTKTWTIYNNYGDEAIASDYKNDVKNIIATSRTKSIKITGNELDNLINGGNANDELIGGDGSDTVHGNDGKDTLYGGAGNDVLYGDKGNDELHGDSGNDKLYGGEGNDILFGTEGKNTLNGGKDTDTLVGGKGEDVFVHENGDGNDLVLDYNHAQGDKLKFDNELIEDVKIDGTDVIITTENGEKLTIKNVAGQEISYINTRGNVETIDRNGNKPKSADSIYVKATRLVNSANKTVNSTKNSARDELYNSVNSLVDFEVSELKENVTLTSISGKKFEKKDLPNIIYKKISDILAEALEGSSLSEGYVKSVDGKLVEQIYSQIKSGLTTIEENVKDEKTGITYKLSGNVMAYSGVGNAFVNVSWSGNQIWVVWKNLDKDSGREGFRNYLSALADLNKEVWKDFLAAWLEPVTGTKTRKALDLAEKIIEALCYKDDSKAKALVQEIGEDYLDKLKTDAKEWFGASVKKVVRKFISNYIPKGDKILEAVDKINEANSAFEDLKDQYDKIGTLVENYKNLSEGNLENAWSNLQDDYETLEELYDEFNNALEGNETKASTFFNSVKEAFQGIQNLFRANDSDENSGALSGGQGNTNTIFVTNNGDISNSSQEAALSVDVVNNTLVQTALNSSDQIYGIGSEEDSMDWIVNTSSGNDSIKSDSSKNSTVNTGDGNDTIIVSGTGNVYANADTGNDVIKINNAVQGKTTINGGKGNDTIENNNKSSVMLYDSGDGSDFIKGFNATSTISIAGANYSSTKSNEDLILTVGKDKITLIGASDLSTVNIIGTLNGESDSTQADTTHVDTTQSGQDQFNPVQIIKNTTGIDVNRFDSIVLSDPNSLNSTIKDGTKLLNVSSNTGVINVDLCKFNYPQAVSLGSGNQSIQFNDANGNIAIVDENATGRKNILFGKGDDLGVFTSPNSNVKVAVGSGYDSIVVDNDARVNVDMAKADDAIIIANDSKVTLTNYNASSNAGVLVPNVDDIASAVKDNSIQLVNNEVLLDSSTSVKFNDKSNDSTIVNLITDDGEIQKVGFTNSSGGELNTGKFNDNFVLKGNYAESSSDKQKRGGSTITAGKGSDTILAGARDIVDGGNGKNQIYLTPYDLRSNKDGATIATSGNGRNTVYGFHDGLDYDSDCIKIGKLSDLTFKFESDGLLLNSGDSRLKFDGIGIDSSYSDNSEYLPSNLNADEPELILLTDGSSTVNAAIAQTNQSVSINSNDLETPNAFFGNRSGLNFSDFDDDLNIDLAKGIGNLGNTNATFKGINKLQAGNGKNSLIGSNDKNTLIAGNGYNSIWSGANNDKMIGKSGSEDKDGSTTFFFLAGDEHDIIANFEFITEDNKYDDVADKIDISNNVVTDVYHSGGDVVLQINDSSDYLTIKDAYGKDFRINNLIAKVDRNIAYDGLANYYVADGGSSLIVDSSIGSAEIWLDNSHGTTFIGNISKLDASAVKGETSLVGNEFNNTIIAGQGDSSMWGGSSNSNDMLIGGESRNTFFYCLGNGNDTITGINDGDRIILSTVTLDQITGTNITAEGVSINFADGGSLQINGTANTTYQLADASRYSANHERLQWEMK